jgi:hypothetical protein
MKHVGNEDCEAGKGFAAWKAPFQSGDSNTLTEAASRKTMLPEIGDGPDPDGQDASRQKKADPERLAKVE